MKPTFLYGTAWKEDDTQLCVETAIAAGFRAIDTANQRKHYFEAAVGDALDRVYARGVLARKDIFLQTKFTFIDGQDHRLPYDPKASVQEQVEQSFASSLEHLRTDYLDSYVLHGPSGSRGLSSADWEAWHAMEGLARKGSVRHLGVSNVNAVQLALLHKDAGIKPAFVQNRCYARRGWDREIRAFCRENGITYQGFSLLTANPEVFGDPRFHEILRRVGCTPAQAIFGFSIHVGMLPLTGTTDRAHMDEDLKSLGVALTPEDARTIESLS